MHAAFLVSVIWAENGTKYRPYHISFHEVWMLQMIQIALLWFFNTARLWGVLQKCPCAPVLMSIAICVWQIKMASKLKLLYIFCQPNFYYAQLNFWRKRPCATVSYSVTRRRCRVWNQGFRVCTRNQRKKWSKRFFLPRLHLKSVASGCACTTWERAASRARSHARTPRHDPDNWVVNHCQL